MDYTILLRSLRVEFCFPPLVKSTLYVLACIPQIKLCKTTHRETLHMPEDKGVQCKCFPDMKKGAPKFCGSILAGD